MCCGRCCGRTTRPRWSRSVPLAKRDALAVLAAASTPEQGQRLSQDRTETVLRKAGRQCNIAATAAKIRAALSSEQLTIRPGVVQGYAANASALIVVPSDSRADRGVG